MSTRWFLEDRLIQNYHELSIFSLILEVDDSPFSNFLPLRLLGRTNFSNDAMDDAIRTALSLKKTIKDLFLYRATRAVDQAKIWSKTAAANAARPSHTDCRRLELPGWKMEYCGPPTSREYGATAGPVACGC